MNAFFLLSSVAEPDLHDISVHTETVGHVADLLSARLGTGGEERLEGLSQQLVDVRPLLAAT